MSEPPRPPLDPEPPTTALLAIAGTMILGWILGIVTVVVLHLTH